uniref:Type I restriction-modification system M subunit n=1 Tax=uncultured bacterium contig00062 TaxID=1181545 RepID=A0A806KJZ0_9BACT|nr:type I restriction-modification system M subunit [uncultured bacterium contig00062]
MEEVKVYLFMICDRRISQYKGIGKDNQRDFQLQRYSNDETSIVFQGFTDDFWNEWKYNSSYHENDNVAFAFLSDDETFNPEIKQDFNFIQPAAFFPKTLIMEFMEKLEFNNITLVYKGKEEKIFNKAVFGYEGQKKFYLKMYPSEPSENYVEQSDSSEYTFIDFLKELRENNIEQLVSKPENTGIIPDNDDHNQSPISQASVEDRIKSLISNGESMRIEFKETFSKNAKNIKNPRDPELIRESLKTIVAFLNTYGGTLLIGVTDKGEIKGVEDDFLKIETSTYFISVVILMI